MSGVWKRVLASVLVLSFAFGLGGCESAEQKRAALREGLEEPQLAVFDLAEAAEAGDVTGVRTYMDSTAVALSFARATMDRARADDEPTGSSSHGSTFPATKMERTFAEGFTTSVIEGVESGTVVAEGTLLAAILEQGPGAIEFLNTDEALVSVEVPATEEDEARSARLRMLRTGDRWMLVAVEDTPDLLRLFF